MTKEKRKIVEAHPQVIFMSEIKIMKKKLSVSVGGFTINGGFYLREEFNLVRKKEKKVMEKLRDKNTL